MNNNQFLIPANSKKSMLILSFFNITDLIIFGGGCTLTFILLMIFNTNNSIESAILILLPAIITGILVLPVPNHHNVRTFIINVYTYFANRRTYFWKGWCVRNGK